MADDVAVMHRGRLVEQGPVRSVLKNPQHAYTKALLDALPSRHALRR
jgi:peptide/nickel transport system ATP-binding protein